MQKAVKQQAFQRSPKGVQDRTKRVLAEKPRGSQETTKREAMREPRGSQERNQEGARREPRDSHETPNRKQRGNETKRAPKAGKR